MSKRLILVLTLALVAGLAFAAYAEVQNVKVSGDITVSGVYRNDFDLTKPQTYGTLQTSNFQDKEENFMSITRVRVDADLTDNVSATVRLLNERDWNGESTKAGYANQNIGLTSATSAEENEIELDLAYVTLKEFLYSPLTLTIGRQELHFGNELIVGDPDTNIYSATTSLAEGDLSARKSFDALRATLDYNPVVVDLVYAKIQEGDSTMHDDKTLMGINASYAMNNNTTIEGYLFSKVTGSAATKVYNIDAGNITYAEAASKPDIVNALGIRAVDKTLKNLTLNGELAWQFGRYNPKYDSNARYDTTTSDGSVGAKMHPRNAWAAQIKAAYDLKDMAMVSKYSPMVSAGYSYLSGADRNQKRNKAYTGWDPMFENQTTGHIMNAIFANTNSHTVSLGAKAKLTEDLTANVDYAAAWFAKCYPSDAKAILSGVYGTAGTSDANQTGGRIFMMTNHAFMGQEVDARLTYDYTEDVQIGLLGGLFLDANNIRDRDHSGQKGQKAIAKELIASMKVTF